MSATGVTKDLPARIMKGVNQANRAYGLLAHGDRILVAVSGGKDSWAMLWALMELKKHAPYTFELVPFHLDQGQPGHDVGPIRHRLQTQGLPFEIELQDTYSRVIEKTAPNKIYCSLCSRFRRAILYKAALRHGCNKVALGHHRDDIIETLLLNIFFAGQMKSMPPRLRSDRGTQEVIRPLAYVAEADLRAFADEMAFPIVPCNLCGSQQKERAFVKQLLQTLEARSPHIRGNIMAALKNVVPSHLLDPAINPAFKADDALVDDALRLDFGEVKAG